ncbi:5,10-methylenetetrahydrofolate reductase [Corynebacterium sp. sy017]|uniref:methylenetetrahydrofolate reductase n=1 Tax=unclassified Corynebacterium TaxID=2624378 RepID=UPI001186C8EE|nr:MULTISPECIES: methylenetetrahydrofolate reductase [unclassified Corynebacterium]MBP3087971.1 5,10-methylenetetrahydrofolate reductase [Corynebacterium sp. sy017]QDZ42928.1 5,10-methylenetetrahydrofolate reductase [Corynebacterium sp. sy039]TSD92502.1 5,10-methylenetetrahydrofolate reductase [Corynebacterium sp. SY003]
MSFSSVPASYQRTITDVISTVNPGRVPFSVEFMPPRDDAAEQRLWKAAEVFHDLGAAFVSVTYGAGGSSRERTTRIAHELAHHPLTTLVHLTLVNHTEEELVSILTEYAQAGLSNLLALRGDPPGADPLGPWTKTPGGYEYAQELIELTRRLPQTQHFQVGIASFPEGHFRAPSLAADTEVTLAKLRAGAEFSITQMFFDVEYYLRLRDRLLKADSEHGAKPIIPGIMPITSMRSLARQTELSGAHVPSRVHEQLRRAAECGGDDEVRKVGIELSTLMAERLIAEGAPDLHFMTLNFARATQEVLHNLGMAPAWGAALGHDAVR